MCAVLVELINIFSAFGIASYPGAQGGGERAPGTHCLRMRLISQTTGKIVYFSNLPCYVDVINN